MSTMLQPVEDQSNIQWFENSDNVRYLLSLLNGKRESISKSIYLNLDVDVAAIQELNREVTDKLALFDTKASTTSVEVLLNHGRTINFESIGDFSNHNWAAESKSIKSLVLRWDFFITLPSYRQPQRHTLTVRISDDVVPDFILDLGFMDSDDAEFFRSPTVRTRVDFINNIIADELVQIIENWAESRKRADDVGFRRFAKKHFKLFRYIASFSGQSILPMISVSIVKWMYYRQIVTIENLVLIVLGILLMIPAFSPKLSDYFSHRITVKITGYWKSHVFNITHSDYTVREQIKKVHDERSPWVFFILSTLVAIFCMVLPFLLHWNS